MNLLGRREEHLYVGRKNVRDVSRGGRRKYKPSHSQAYKERPGKKPQRGKVAKKAQSSETGIIKGILDKAQEGVREKVGGGENSNHSI